MASSLAAGRRQRRSRGFGRRLHSGSGRRDEGTGLHLLQVHHTDFEKPYKHGKKKRGAFPKSCFTASEGRGSPPNSTFQKLRCTLQENLNKNVCSLVQRRRSTRPLACPRQPRIRGGRYHPGPRPFCFDTFGSSGGLKVLMNEDVPQ